MLIGASFAQPADQPVRRGDANSRLAHEQLLAKAKQGRIDVYFVGDSITRRWGATDYPEFLAHWKRTFHGWNAGNFGWGGDSIQHILWRLQHGELDGVNPTVIVILAGTNNVGGTPPDDAKIADITRGVEALLDTCREKAPAAKLLLTAIFPRNDNLAVVPGITRINTNLARLAAGKSIRFLIRIHATTQARPCDRLLAETLTPCAGLNPYQVAHCNVNDRLADADGRLFDGMMVDRLHPTLKGYAVWADGLKPILTELLGPPAATDLAPPPTGDPSAARRK